MDNRVVDQPKPLASETDRAATDAPRHPFAPPRPPRWLGVVHVTSGSPLTDDRLQAYARAVAGHSVGQAEADARATALLAHSVQMQANVLAYIDGFMIIGFAVIGMLLLMLLVRAPPEDSGALDQDRPSPSPTVALSPPD